jgi:hypothetical protein
MLTLSWKAYWICAVLLLPGPNTKRAHRLHGFANAQLIQATKAFRGAGNADGASELDAVIESVRPDTKHSECAIAQVLTDGAGGSGMG